MDNSDLNMLFVDLDGDEIKFIFGENGVETYVNEEWISISLNAKIATKISQAFAVIAHRIENDRSESGVVLKPCPFCGSDAGLYERFDGDLFVACRNVKCLLSRLSGIGSKTKKDAAAAWNKREGDE